MPVQAQERNRNRVKQVPDEAAERVEAAGQSKYLSAGFEWDNQRVREKEIFKNHGFLNQFLVTFVW